jgi:hypothetical protein
MDKTLRSRLTYELVETDLFVNDLKCKYKLPDTVAYNDFMEQKIVNFSQIDPEFYETPAFSDSKWKNVNFKDRHLFTRYACHGFHHKLCKRKVYHTEASVKCKCKFCNQQIDYYHLFKCPDENCPKLSQLAKNKV